MKKCPYCAEEIQDAAIICRYCGRDLPPAEPPTVEEEQEASAPPAVESRQQSPGCLTIYFTNVLRRLVWLFIIGGILYVVSWAQGYQTPSPAPTSKPIPTSTNRPTATRFIFATPTSAAVQVVFTEPAVGAFVGDTIILKTDVYYRAVPTGDEAYWVVTGTNARAVADEIIQAWNDSFQTKEGYTVNVTTREVNKKLNIPYSCTLLSDDTAVSLYAYGEYLYKSVCK